ncbi:hypothetical protein NPIL_81931, partial [Nephila pilipes]
DNTSRQMCSGESPQASSKIGILDLASGNPIPSLPQAP